MDKEVTLKLNKRQVLILLTAIKAYIQMSQLLSHSDIIKDDQDIDDILNQIPIEYFE